MIIIQRESTTIMNIPQARNRDDPETCQLLVKRPVTEIVLFRKEQLTRSSRVIFCFVSKILKDTAVIIGVQSANALTPFEAVLSEIPGSAGADSKCRLPA